MSLIFEKLLEYKFSVVYINKLECEIYSLNGDKMSYLILDSDEKEIDENYIKLNGLQAIFGLKKEKIVVDQTETINDIQIKINHFFKRITKKKEEGLSSIFYKEFKNYIENVNNSNGILTSLQGLDKFFSNSIQKEERIQLFLKWIFSHKVLIEVLSVKASNIELLEKDSIFCVFKKALQLFEKKIEVVSKETLAIVKSKTYSTNFIQLLYFILEELKKAIEWNNRESTFTNEGAYLSRYYFSEEVLNSISKKQNVGFSASVGFDLIEYILETSVGKTKYNIYCESIGDYYFSLFLLERKKLNDSIKLFFLDLSTIILPKKNIQKAVYNENDTYLSFNSLNGIETFIYDFGRYVDNLTANENIKTSIKNGKRLEGTLNAITAILRNIPPNSKCLALFNTHLVYNSHFKSLRNWVSRNYSGQLKELKLKQPLVPLIVNLNYKISKVGIKYLQLNEEGKWFEKAILLEEEVGNLQFFEKRTIPLFLKNNSENGIFIRSYKALFNKKKRMPLVSNEKVRNSICIIKKPFYNNVFVVKNDLYSAIEAHDNQFYTDNTFLCLGFENSHNKRVFVPTKYYPTYHFLEKLYCFPLLNKNTRSINISDNAYTFFRKKLIKSIEGRLSHNIEEKNKQLNIQVSKLIKLTSSLPVLNKFTLQIEEWYDSNTEENISKVNIRYYNVLKKFKDKISTLKKGARERKRLLSTIESEVLILESLLDYFVNIESACYKELSLLTKENIFYYTLAVTNSKMYYQEYGYHLVYNEPLIPFLPNMWEWVFYGKRLKSSFSGNVENKFKFKVEKLSNSNVEQYFEQIKIFKKIGSILINNEIEISDLPPTVWEYEINKKSPVEWKVEEIRKRYKGKKLDVRLKHKIVDEIIRSCNTALQINQTINKINQLDFKLTD